MVALALALNCATAGAIAGAAAEEPAVSAPTVPAVERSELESRRAAAYHGFREAFEAGRYNDALPAAEQVVALTEAIDPQHAELATALDNLGATHYRLGDFVAAELAYLRALRLIEEKNGASSRRLIAPLLGLGRTYQSGGHHELAAPLLERAVAISRHADGLFAAEQREALLPLIDSYVALARWKDVDREEHYALRVAEHQYGSNDLRLLPALQRLARWYEIARRSNEARRVWQRMLAIASDRAHQSLGGTVNALRGYANTFRIDYQYGPDLSEEEANAGTAFGPHTEVARDAFGRRIGSGSGPIEYRLENAGRDALEAALQLLTKHAAAVPPEAIAAVQLDLADWQLVAGRWDKALPLYLRALPALPAETGTPDSPLNPLAYPAQLLYRAPPLARRYRDLPASEVTEKVAIAECTVTADGKVTDVKIVEGDANDVQRGALATALARSVWRPRFVDGKPVATEKVRVRESFRSLQH